VCEYVFIYICMCVCNYAWNNRAHLNNRQKLSLRSFSDLYDMGDVFTV